MILPSKRANNVENNPSTFAPPSRQLQLSLKYGNTLFLLCQSFLLKIMDFHPNLKTKIMSPEPPLTDLPKLSLKKLMQNCSTMFEFLSTNQKSPNSHYDEIPTKSHDFMPLLENSLKSLQMLKPSLMLQKAQMLIKSTIIQSICTNQRLLSLNINI